MLVRQLTRRGVNRPSAHREPLLEIVEVFRVDVLAIAMAGQLPDLHVRYYFTQNPNIWEVDFPLEDLALPQEPEPVALSAEHPAAHYGRVYFKAIFEGDLAPLLQEENSFLSLQPGHFRQVWETFGNRGAAIWAMQPPYEDYFSFYNINLINARLGEVEEEEREAIMLTVAWVLENYPQFGLLLLPAVLDLVQVMFFRAWLLSGAGPEGQGPLIN